MRKAIDILGNMISTKQYKMSIEIMELFSQYRSFTGHEISKLKVINALHITPQKYDYIVAGSTDINPVEYTKMIKYLNHQCDLVNSKYRFIIYAYMDRACDVKSDNEPHEIGRPMVNNINNICFSKKSNEYKRSKKASNYKVTTSSKYAINI